MTSFKNCFGGYYAPSGAGLSGIMALKVIPGGLFSNCPAVETFAECFQYASIEAIRAGLFANNPQVTSFASCFYGARKLLETPEELFQNNPAGYLLCVLLCQQQQ